MWRCAACEKKQAEHFKKWKRKNHARWLVYYNEWQRKKTIELRAKVFTHYGRKCACCGESDIRFLTLDHTEVMGSKDPRVHFALSGWRMTGLALYRRLIKLGYPKGFQPFCWNCNQGKALYGGGIQCPHEM